MAVDFSGKLVIAISSRALFDLDEANRIFEDQGIEQYARYQVSHEDEMLRPGAAFPLVKKLLALNHGHESSPRVEVILLSRNSADTGLRIFNSIERHGLAIGRAAFTSGASPYRYVPAFNAHLFLSTNPDDVRKALEAGYAGATILAAPETANEHAELRIAFDGDAVLFSDEAERVYQSEGLSAFAASEKAAAKHPLSGGPFKSFLAALHRLQQDRDLPFPIRTALVTARSAPAHERVIRTLREWQIRIDEALFLGGLDKGAFLQAFGADVFFDDQHRHCQSASRHVATGHVPHGVVNE